MKSTERRVAHRKILHKLHIRNFTALDTFAVIAKVGLLVDVSATGLMIQLDRKDIIPKNLRQNLNLDSLIGEHVMIHIEEMDLELDGEITRTQMVGKGVFEVGIDFTDEAPEYWRECLVELLPTDDDIS